MEFIPHKCFTDFTEKVSNARQQGDLDPATSIIADTMKLLGNSGYGSLIMNKEKHQSTVYVRGKSQACLKVNEPIFKTLAEINDDIFELQLSKKNITLDLPIILGYFILQN